VVRNDYDSAAGSAVQLQLQLQVQVQVQAPPSGHVPEHRPCVLCQHAVSVGTRRQWYR
jgi:hypothetical protein